MQLEEGSIVGDKKKGTALFALDPEFKSKMEKLLPTLAQSLRNLNNHLLRKAKIRQTADIINIAPRSLNKIITRYELHRLKENRKIPYYHYHQTSIGNLTKALRSPELALLSMREQEKRGETFDSEGSRPDLVQFTTDQTDHKGNLEKRAIQSVGATGTGVTLVYKESLTQEDDFDIFDFYHGVPIAPFSQVETILCNSPIDMQTVQKLLKDSNLQINVDLVERWYANLDANVD